MSENDGIGNEDNGASEMREESETPVCLEREWRCEGREGMVSVKDSTDTNNG